MIAALGWPYHAELSAISPGSVLGEPGGIGSLGVETSDERKWMQFRTAAVIEGTSPWTVARHAVRPNRYQK
jgi:hypothetical protein